MHCGSPVTVTGTKDKTMTEDLEATVLESSGDLYETTVLISPGTVPSKGKDHRVSKERISIGKQENSDIVIKRDFISRSHALLLYENHQFILSDLHSTNHTYVNGEIISKKVLKDNDIIKFGDAVYKFKCL
jgi:pSer/pThr/pTyr-binding forkhead associated (FHA) protein